MSARNSSRRDYHIVVLGAGCSGERADFRVLLLAQFVQNIWIESYDPTIEDSYRKQIEVDIRHRWHGTIQELYMKTGQGFLLVFSITSQSSLNELSDLREQIIRIKDDENVPIVIVGNKSDLDQDRMVSRQEAFTVSQNWGNAPYYETSARRRDLCRQIIRRDNNHSSQDYDDEANSPTEKKHKRRRFGRCVIL
ncbi:transforming p21b protein [Rutstroemia sp. NJR-2017a BBW]|nr:transforming p21b protein [Rutstroemia sp. NJR-2017a BBW]